MDQLTYLCSCRLRNRSSVCCRIALTAAFFASTRCEDAAYPIFSEILVLKDVQRSEIWTAVKPAILIIFNKSPYTK